VRGCVGAPRAEPVFHPGLPPEVALHICPMRAAMEPDVARLVALYARCERYHVLPRPGGLWRQPARVMLAFDAMRDALRLPRPERRDPHA
jgi:hypothetical protein